jgi:ubiquinone/menaquinone biosynthesis C-methylase UbiE
MAKSELLARQSRLPTGWLGWWVARIMALDTGRMNDDAVERLDAQAGERILEVGCGHGLTLKKLAKRTGAGCVAGVDPSEVMRHAARRRNSRDTERGRIRIDAGTADRIPHPDRDFDKALSVHTLYFWPDLEAGLREIHRCLRPGGELLLGYRPADDPDAARQLPDSIYELRGIAEVEAALGVAGYRDVKSERRHNPKSQVAWTRARA